MALSDNRIKSNWGFRFYQKNISMIYNNKILGFMMIFIVATKIIKYDNNSLLGCAGRFYNLTNTAASYLDGVFNNVKKYFISLDTLENENKLLRQEISILHDELVDLELIKQHALELKELLNFTSLLKVDYVSAKMLSIINSAQGAYGLIDCGKNSGINVGDAVVANKGLIGKVSQVSQSYSKVLLITNPKFRIPVVTSSGQRAILIGNKLQPYISYFESIAEIKPQDLITTSGDRGSLPINIPIAKVSRIEDKVYLKLISNLDGVNFVSIIKAATIAQ
jgi:rod shape-determining protein MreC